MRKWIILMVSALLTLSAACGKKQSSVRVEKIDGVEWVHNNAEPEHPQRTVSFVHELAIGEKEEDKLFQPAGVTVSNDGRMFILDRSDMTVKVYDVNGAYVQSIGRMGDGPGEFKGVTGMLFTPDGHLAVLDIQLRRVSIFNGQGAFIKSCQLTQPMIRFYLLTDSTFTGDANLYGEKHQLFVKTYDFTGKELLSFGQFTPAEFKTLRQTNVAFSISLPYPVMSVFAGDLQRQWLYHCRNDQYLLEVYDRSGRLFRKIDRPYAPVAVTDKDKEDYYSGFDKNSNPIFTKMAREVELPKNRTITELLLTDDHGNLWLKTNEDREEDGESISAYDIFDPHGVFQTRVWTGLEPRLFAKGKMYARQTDKETDAVSIHRYSVQWSELKSPVDAKSSLR